MQTCSSRQEACDGWLERVRRTPTSPLSYQTTVHPCVIDGERSLVYRSGLAKEDPEGFARLRRFASSSGFRLKEDQRRQALPVPRDRRRRGLPLMTLGIALLGTGYGLPAPAGDEVLPEIEVLGAPSEQPREYLIRNGKRFVSGPYGEVEAILDVADVVRNQGRRHRISNRRLRLPGGRAHGFIDRYDYRFPEECGGGRFSYFEGEGFGALGYHDGKRVILDVLVGGGPFAAPGLWGPYDQILNDNVHMHLMWGDGARDGMGLLKASYNIGLVPTLDEQDLQSLGDRYSGGVRSAAGCQPAGVRPRVATTAAPGTGRDPG